MVLPAASSAQSLVLDQTEVSSWNAVPFAVSISTSDSISPEQALAQFESADPIKGNTAFGFSQDFFWIRVPVCKRSEGGKTFVLEVDNPHIDLIQCWSVADSVIRPLGISGDRIPFADRTIDNRRNLFKFRFEGSSCLTLLLMVDKRNAAVTVPLRVYSDEAFQYSEIRQTLIYGFYFGMLLLILLYSILISVNQRKATYLWYAVYVFFLALYLFVYIGFGFQLLYPSSITLNNYARLVLVILILASQIRFTQFFLQLPVHRPKLNRAFSGLALVGVLIILWWLVFPGLFTTYTVWVINMVYVLMGIAVVMLIVALTKTFRKQRSTVVFYAVAFSMNIIALLLVVAEEYGLVELSGWPLSPMFLGSFFEIMIFSVGLSYRSRLISDDRDRLLGSIQSLKREAMSAYLNGVEQEKKRIASELHDDIASRLSLLKRAAETEDAEAQVPDVLTHVIERVRQISYSLNPVALDEDTFSEQVRKLVAEYRATGMDVSLQAFDLPESIPKQLGLELFRILQEALQNVQKYASATRVDVQLFKHDGELTLAIEDNGKGFDQETTETGMGIRNMRSRAELCGGSFDISSAPSKGTSIMVSVPLVDN